MASPQANIQRRGPEDSTFRWSPTEPLQVNVAVTGGTADYIEVSDIVSYEIGITPDLNWDTQADMFNPYNPKDPNKTNTRLFTKKDLSVDEGTLTWDGAEEQVYVTLSDDEMDSFMSDGFPDYLWAIRGYTRDGAISAWSSFRRFAGRYQAADNSFSVNDLDEVSKSRTVTLRGSKTSYIRAVEVNGHTGAVRYPSDDSWEMDVVLQPGDNTFNVRGHPNFGRATAWRKVETSLFTGEVGLKHIPNTFDHFGSLFGIDRLTSFAETNDNFATRIKDVFAHQAESNLQGLHYSISRNLDLSYDDQALVVRPALTADGRRSDDLYGFMTLDIQTDKIYLGSIDFVVNHEYHQVTPQDVSITLDNEVVLQPDGNELARVFSPAGTPVPTLDYEVDYINRKITFVEGYQYKDVWVDYSRKLETDIGTSVTLFELKTGLEGLSYNGETLLEVSMSTDRSGFESSDGLLRFEAFLRGNQRFVDPLLGVQLGTPLRWSDLSLHHLLDPKYWLRYYNEDGHLLNTKIEAHVDSFRKKAHTTWGQVVLDEDVWDPVDETTETAANLPFVLDAKFGYWTSSKLAETVRYETSKAFDRGYIAQHDKSLMVYIGVPTEKIKSGIGRDDDLKVVIPKPKVSEVLAEPDVYRATISWSVTGQVDDATFLPSTPYGSLIFGL